MMDQNIPGGVGDGIEPKKSASSSGKNNANEEKNDVSERGRTRDNGDSSDTSPPLSILTRQPLVSTDDHQQHPQQLQPQRRSVRRATSLVTFANSLPYSTPFESPESVYQTPSPDTTAPHSTAPNSGAPDKTGDHTLDRQGKHPSMGRRRKKALFPVNSVGPDFRWAPSLDSLPSISSSCPEPAPSLEY